MPVRTIRGVSAQTIFGPRSRQERHRRTLALRDATTLGAGRADPAREFLDKICCAPACRRLRDEALAEAVRRVARSVEVELVDDPLVVDEDVALLKEAPELRDFLRVKEVAVAAAGRRAPEAVALRQSLEGIEARRLLGTNVLVIGYQDARKLRPGEDLSAKARKARDLRERGQQIKIMPEVDFTQLLTL